MPDESQHPPIPGFVPEGEEIPAYAHPGAEHHTGGIHNQPGFGTPTMAVGEPLPPAPQPSGSGSSRRPPMLAGKSEDEDDDDDGMLRMSFLDHLEELRSRLISCVAGLAVAFVISMTFSTWLWRIISAPATSALTNLGLPGELVQIAPMDTVSIVWVKLPMICSLFIASPWLLWQVWAFISPGLYPKERRFAAPFVLSAAGLFIAGGLFAYFVAFRFGLEFLLGFGRDLGNVRPLVSVTEYFDLFVNVILGVSLIFELPIIIFLLILLRIVTAKFLIANSRYAILIIVIIAAVVTPTPDVFNLMLFSVPMVFLYFAGVFVGWIFELRREKKKFPWQAVAGIVASVLLLCAAGIYVMVTYYGYKLIDSWPFLVNR